MFAVPSDVTPLLLLALLFMQTSLAFSAFMYYYKLFFGEDNGTPLQYSCLENPMDGGAW